MKEEKYLWEEEGEKYLWEEEGENLIDEEMLKAHDRHIRNVGPSPFFSGFMKVLLAMSFFVGLFFIFKIVCAC